MLGLLHVDLGIFEILLASSDLEIDTGILRLGGFAFSFADLVLKEYTRSLLLSHSWRNRLGNRLFVISELDVAPKLLLSQVLVFLAVLLERLFEEGVGACEFSVEDDLVGARVVLFADDVLRLHLLHWQMRVFVLAMHLVDAHFLRIVFSVRVDGLVVAGSHRE